MNTKFRYAKNGALIIGVPFLLWSFLCIFSSLGEMSNGSVFSFGVILPSVILGFPWSLSILIVLVWLPVELGEIPILKYIPIIFNFILVILSPSINGGLIGYFIGSKKQKHEEKLEFIRNKIKDVERRKLKGSGGS